jgi:tRNA1(Val) A37 N6-methylase TrmN6
MTGVETAEGAAAEHGAGLDDATFLNGRVRARQPEAGYRASLDTVLLGAAVAAGPGERVVELGCGSGAALLIAAERCPGAAFVGIERAGDLAALAAANALANPTCDRVSVATGDVLIPEPAWREAFDQAFLNPPYYDDPGAVRSPPDPARRAAFVNDGANVADWIRAALGFVRSRGRLTLIHRAERLDAILSALSGASGAICVRAVHPRAAAPARRVLVAATKGARGPLRLLPPLVLHTEEGGWTPEATAILAGDAPFALEA